MDARSGSRRVRDLRKDEPHPVALFPTRPKLLAHPRVDGRLRLHKALQIKAVRP